MRLRRAIVSSSTLGVPDAMSSGIAQYAHSERSGRCSLAPQLGQWVLTGACVDIGGVRRAGKSTFDLACVHARRGAPDEHVPPRVLTRTAPREYVAMARSARSDRTRSHRRARAPP